MTPGERVKALQGLAKLVCEIEAMAHYQIVKMDELRARIEAMARELQQIEAIEGGGQGLAGGGELVGEGAETDAGGVGGAELVEAVAVDEQKQGLGLGCDAGQGALEVEDANEARVVRAGAAVGPSVDFSLTHGAVTERGAVVGPLAQPAHG